MMFIRDILELYAKVYGPAAFWPKYEVIDWDEAAVEAAIDSLSEIEASLIKAKFFEHKTKKSFEEEHGISPNRYREIRREAFYKMKYLLPPIIRSSEIADKTAEVLFEAKQRGFADGEWNTTWGQLHRVAFTPDTSSDGVKNYLRQKGLKDIGDMGFSKKTHDALELNGIVTLKQLVLVSVHAHVIPEYRAKISRELRNKNVAKEIREKMESLGYTDFKWPW